MKDKNEKLTHTKEKDIKSDFILERYSNANGGGGDEKEIRNEIYKDIKDYVDEIKIDPLGNLKGTQYKEIKNSFILLTAHMDEVALIVEKVDSNGLVNFKALGGFVEKILPGTSVIIGKDRVPGVIGLKSYHIMSPAEREKAPDIKSLFIDIGASSDKDASVKPGDIIYFTSKFFTQNNHYFGKAFDDRAGCTAITEILKDNSSKISIAFSYNVQEEVGLRGGAVCAWEPENILFNLNLEGTTCSDRDLDKNYSPSTELGKGPAITIMDRTSIANRKLLDFVINIAEKNNIPYQFKQTVTGGTDAGYIHQTKEGIPSITISVPVRYIHSPWGIINKNDYENYIKLAKLIVNEGHKFKI